INGSGSGSGPVSPRVKLRYGRTRTADSRPRRVFLLHPITRFFVSFPKSRLPDQRHEGAAVEANLPNRILVPADQDQFLKIAAADGQYHAPADRELLNEWLRNLRSCGRDKDHVIWSLGSVPKGAIGYYNFNVPVSQAGEALTSHLGQLRVAFDTEDASDD